MPDNMTKPTIGDVMKRLLLALAALALFAAPAHAAKLSWAPWPTDANTITVNVPPTGLDMVGDPTKNYLVVMPNVPVTPKLGVGCVRIESAKMVKIIGGECNIPWQGFPYDSKTRRCFSFNDIRWWLHVEGVWCHGDVLDFAEYSGVNAAVTYENVRAEGISARDEDLFTDGHPDGVYVYDATGGGGARSVRMDYMTISTDYQAVFVKHPSSSSAEPIYLRNTNLIGTPETGNHLQQLLWRENALNSLALINVWLSPQLLGNGTQESLIKAVKPSDTDPVVANRAYWVDATTVGWPTSANITGVVKKGPPPGGDFVPPGVAGIGYISPGYVF